jgi:hypothetical protein
MYNAPRKMESTFSHSSVGETDSYEGRQKPTAPIVEKSIHFSKLNVNEKLIEETFSEIKSEEMAQMVGMISHFVYWAVFGHFNKNPIDDFYIK